MNRAYAAIAIAVGVFVSNSALARNKEPNCNWTKPTITSHRIDVADAALFSPNGSQVAVALAKHLPFGMPQNSSDGHGEKLLAQEHYIIWYDTDLRAPLWTAHMLTKEDVAAKQKRADSFRSDPRLSEAERSECADYVEPIFDQGHMVPNGDMTRSPTAMDDTFLMSNMTPQNCAFNRGVWQVLEQRVRTWATDQGKIWVITDAIFDRKAPIGRDADEDAWRMNGKKGRRVGIPSDQYKIVVRQHSGGGFDSISIKLPNNDTLVPKSKIPKYIEGHVTTLASIAQRSGFRFLANSNVTEGPTLWESNAKWAGPLTANCKPSYPSH